jgi:hypothetical protein
MKERPILFSGPMVNAILENRKTQTRRVVNIDHVALFRSPSIQFFQQRVEDWVPDGELWDAVDGLCDVLGRVRCPYGQPGDRLWVRETWKPYTEETGDCGIRYRADGAFINHENSWQGADRWLAVRRPEEQYPQMKPPKWRPSIHMPRWASRITLEITDVRVERLQEISEADARAEGIRFADHGKLCWHKGGPPGDVGDCPAPDHTHQQRPGYYWKDGGATNSGECLHTARSAFGNLWDSINAKKHPWESNPWVWVIEFRRVNHEH